MPTNMVSICLNPLLPQEQTLRAAIRFLAEECGNLMRPGGPDGDLAEGFTEELWVEMHKLDDLEDEFDKLLIDKK